MDSVKFPKVNCFLFCHSKRHSDSLTLDTSGTRLYRKLGSSDIKCKINWLSPGADANPIMDVPAFLSCSLPNLFPSWFTVYLYGLHIVMYTDVAHHWNNTALFIKEQAISSFPRQEAPNAQ